MSTRCLKALSRGCTADSRTCPSRALVFKAALGSKLVGSYFRACSSPTERPSATKSSTFTTTGSTRLRRGSALATCAPPSTRGPSRPRRAVFRHGRWWCGDLRTDCCGQWGQRLGVRSRGRSSCSDARGTRPRRAPAGAGRRGAAFIARCALSRARHLSSMQMQGLGAGRLGSGTSLGRANQSPTLGRRHERDSASPRRSGLQRGCAGTNAELPRRAADPNLEQRGGESGTPEAASERGPDFRRTRAARSARRAAAARLSPRSTFSPKRTWAACLPVWARV